MDETHQHVHALTMARARARTHTGRGDKVFLVGDWSEAKIRKSCLCTESKLHYAVHAPRVYGVNVPRGVNVLRHYRATSSLCRGSLLYF